jgi:hypothetical protein
MAQEFIDENWTNVLRSSLSKLKGIKLDVAVVIESQNLKPHPGSNSSIYDRPVFGLIVATECLVQRMGSMHSNLVEIYWIAP